MLSASSIFNEIHDDDEAFRFFVSVAAKGEAQGGWENERIASLTEDDELRPKIRRHGADEDKHGRLFASLLRKRGLEPAEVPLEADYCMQLERQGVGLAHQRLQEERTLAPEELLAYLVHSRVTEQRASEEVDFLVRIFGDHDEIGPVVRMIADDEINHLSYCHEELLRLSREGFDRQIRDMLDRYARAELETYRSISRAFVDAMASLLGWGRAKRGILRFGVACSYWTERLFRRGRMVRLSPPARPRAMG